MQYSPPSPPRLNRSQADLWLYGIFGQADVNRPIVAATRSNGRNYKLTAFRRCVVDRKTVRPRHVLRRIPLGHRRRPGVGKEIAGPASPPYTPRYPQGNFFRKRIIRTRGKWRVESGTGGQNISPIWISPMRNCPPSPQKIPGNGTWGTAGKGRRGKFIDG